MIYFSPLWEPPVLCHCPGAGCHHGSALAWLCAEMGAGTLQGIHPQAWHRGFRMKKNSLWDILELQKNPVLLVQVLLTWVLQPPSRGSTESTGILWVLTCFPPPQSTCVFMEAKAMRRCFPPSASTGRFCRAPTLCPTVPGCTLWPDPQPAVVWQPREPCWSRAGSGAGCRTHRLETPSASPLQTDILETHLHLPLRSQGDLEMGSCS